MDEGFPAATGDIACMMHCFIRSGWEYCLANGVRLWYDHIVFRAIAIVCRGDYSLSC